MDDERLDLQAEVIGDQLPQTEYDSVDITNDFMFSYVMKNEEICKELLQYIFPDHKVKDIKYYLVDEKLEEVEQENPVPDTQKWLSEAFNKRGVRLDVYFDDGTKVYNVEMQTAYQALLPKRARLYQAHIDINQLKRGQNYDQLRPSYVIFICTFDPFGKGQYCYTFQNKCDEEAELELKDESYKVFLNTQGSKGEISDRLREVLRYMNSTRNYPVEDTEIELIRKIDHAVSEAKMDDEWRVAYMTYQIHQRDAELRGEQRGIAIGEQLGAKKTKQETAKKLLLRNIPEDVIAEATGLSVNEIQALRHSAAS